MAGSQIEQEKVRVFSNDKPVSEQVFYFKLTWNQYRDSSGSDVVTRNERRKRNFENTICKEHRRLQVILPKCMIRTCSTLTNDSK